MLVTCEFLQHMIEYRSKIRDQNFCIFNPSESIDQFIMVIHQGLTNQKPYRFIATSQLFFKDKTKV